MIGGHGIGTANDGLGHMLGHGDTARKDQVDLLAGPLGHQIEMNFADHLF